MLTNEIQIETIESPKIKIPPLMHLIWVGPNALTEKYLDNLFKLVKIAKNSIFEVNLWVDDDSKEVLNDDRFIFSNLEEYLKAKERLSLKKHLKIRHINELDEGMKNATFFSGYFAESMFDWIKKDLNNQVKPRHIYFEYLKDKELIEYTLRSGATIISDTIKVSELAGFKKETCSRGWVLSSDNFYIESLPVLKQIMRITSERKHTVFSSELYFKLFKQYIERERVGFCNYASRADWLRYEILRQEGGYYKDMDDVILDGDTLVQDETQYGILCNLAISKRGIESYGNNLIGSTPHHCVIEDALIHALKEYNKLDTNESDYSPKPSFFKKNLMDEKRYPLPNGFGVIFIKDIGKLKARSKYKGTELHYKDLKSLAQKKGLSQAFVRVCDNKKKIDALHYYEFRVFSGHDLTEIDLDKNCDKKELDRILLDSKNPYGRLSQEQLDTIQKIIKTRYKIFANLFFPRRKITISSAGPGAIRVGLDRFIFSQIGRFSQGSVNLTQQFQRVITHCAFAVIKDTKKKNDLKKCAGLTIKMRSDSTWLCKNPVWLESFDDSSLITPPLFLLRTCYN